MHPAAIDELIPKSLATATVDRLLHHAHVCQTTGGSIHLTQALSAARLERETDGVDGQSAPDDGSTHQEAAA